MLLQSVFRVGTPVLGLFVASEVLGMDVGGGALQPHEEMIDKAVQRCSLCLRWAWSCWGSWWSARCWARTWEGRSMASAWASRGISGVLVGLSSAHTILAFSLAPSAGV